MQFDEYRRHDALGLAALVAKGQVTASELLETAIARMAAVNPGLNAVTLDLTERARGRAKSLPAGPFAGVPFLLKDLSADLAGVPTTSGSAAGRDMIPAEDSATTAAYEKAGLVIFGKTNTSEFGLTPVTEPVLYGPSRNPWDLTRTPGGSSGGSAAAVASGVVPAAHGTDGGGSLRNPASCCGLFGFKPSRGRVSLAPRAEGWGGALTEHALTRSVRDSAALLDLVSRPQAGDPYFLAPPSAPFVTEVARPPGRLRIGFTTAALAGGEIDPACAEAVTAAARLCQSLGHQVEEIKPPASAPTIHGLASTIITVSVATTLDDLGRVRGRPVEEQEVEPFTWLVAQAGRAVSGPAYQLCLQDLHRAGRDFVQIYDSIDVMLTSTLGVPTPPIGWLTEDPAQFSARLAKLTPNLIVFSNTGQPSMSVPLGATPEGLPIGVQFAARLGEEATLFRLAGQLEKAAPWFERLPPI
jgi:amidase